MKAPTFGYHAPTHLLEALDLLARLEDARVLAGGQSLVPMMNLRVAAPRHLIDINRVTELAGIREEDGTIVIGAMTRQRELEHSPLIARRLPLFAEAVRSVGHRQTRNRGTLGGSLCHLDPAAELPVVCMAMDAVLEVSSRRGRRRIAIRDFPAGFMTTSLASDEMLTNIAVRPWSERAGTSFLEYARRHGDFAVVSVAVAMEVDSGGKVERASVTLGGVAEAPVRVDKAEQALFGTKPDAAIPSAARACAEVVVLDDAFYPRWYRQRLAETLTSRAIAIAAKRAVR